MSKSNGTLISVVLLISILGGIFIFPVSGINIAADNIEWNIKTGEHYEWTVTKSNGSDYYLGLNSKMEMSIDTITIPGPYASQVNVTFTVYNSSSMLTETVMDNNQYEYFNHSSESLQVARGWFTDTGFLIPSNYVETFARVLNQTYENKNNFNETSYVILNGELKEFRTYSKSRNQHLAWFFTEYGVTSKFTVTHDGEIIHQVELTSDAKTTGDSDDKDDENPENILPIIILIVSIGGGIAGGGVLYYLKKKGKF